MLTDAIIVLDFETTGFSPERGDRITEVAALRIESGEIVDRFESLINCGVRIPGFITDYTGITQRMVDRAPSVKTVVRDLCSFLDGTPVVAHNASFDQRFLWSECSRISISPSIESLICSMRVTRRVFPTFASHALSSLAEELEMNFGSKAHRAGADAEVTAKIIVRAARELKSAYPHLEVNSMLFRRLMTIPIAKVADRLRQSYKSQA